MEIDLTGFGGFEGVDLLQKLHLFQKLSFDETTRLGAIIESVDVPAGHIVIEENSMGDGLYIISQGEVRITRDANADGKHESSEEIGRLREGEMFGEMSLIDDVLTSARVVTVGPARLLKLPKPAFEALLSSDDKLGIKVYRSFCRTLSERLRRTTAMLAKSQALSVSVR